MAEFRMPAAAEPEPLYRVTLELRPCDAQGAELHGLGYVVFEGVARAWQDHESDTPEVLFFYETPARIETTERRPVMRLDWRAVPGGATEYIARTYSPA
jgi:hypothetical protein